MISTTFWLANFQFWGFIKNIFWYIDNLNKISSIIKVPWIQFILFSGLSKTSVIIKLCIMLNKIEK